MIVPIVVCPMCKGTGKDFSVKHHRQLWCDLCKGVGYVPRENCKGCGRPATTTWPPKREPIIRYCGLKACLEQLVMVHKPGPWKAEDEFERAMRYM